MNTTFYIVDFAWNGPQTLFVELKGNDIGKPFEGMIRIVDGEIYGDLLHKTKSPLNIETRDNMLLYVTEKINNGYFK